MKTINESMAAGGWRVALDRDWLAVAASSVGLLFSVGTLSVYTFGVFVHPLASEFHWSRTDLFATLTILQYVLAFSSPFWGNLCDRFGPRWVLLPSIVCLGLLIASLGLLTPHLWHLYLIFTLIPLLAGGATPLGYSAVLVRLFERHLGLSLGLALTGVGFGALLLPPVTQSLLGSFGWRTTYVVLGALTLVVGLPAGITASRHVPDVPRAMVEQRKSEILPLLRNRVFLAMCTVFLVLGVISVGTLAHLVPMMVDHGLTPAAAARVAGLAGLATLLARGGMGWILDRAPASIVIATISVLTSLSMILFATAATFYLPALLLGSAIGAEVDFIAFLTRRHFPQSVFGRVYGLAFAAYMIGAGSGPLLLAIAFDRTGGYKLALSVFAALGLVSAIVALLIPRRSILPQES